MADTSNTPNRPIASNDSGLGGIPGMGSGAPDFLGELRSEVSAEATPLLVWIGKHIKLIILAFLFLIAIILGFGAWQWHTETAIREASMKLGRIVIIQNPVERLAGLEAYINEAPADMRQGIQLEIAMTALAAQDHNKAVQAYADIRRNAPDSAMGIAAAMNEASLLIQINKAEDAVTVLNEIEKFVPEFMKTQLTERKAFALEQAGRTAEALALYENLAGKLVNSDNDFFRYKINLLKDKLGK